VIEGINSRIHHTEQRISEIEDKLFENKQSGEILKGFVLFCFNETHGNHKANLP
jgi:hypothetical protein